MEDMEVLRLALEAEPTETTETTHERLPPRISYTFPTPSVSGPRSIYKNPLRRGRRRVLPFASGRGKLQGGQPQPTATATATIATIHVVDYVLCTSTSTIPHPSPGTKLAVPGVQPQKEYRISLGHRGPLLALDHNLAPRRVL